MRGIPTVLVTVGPEASRLMRPPRALYPRGFKEGNSFGRPFLPELQKGVLREALLMLKGPARPGEISECDFPEYHTSDQ
jgi:hypothetical protein